MSPFHCTNGSVHIFGIASIGRIVGRLLWLQTVFLGAVPLIVLSACVHRQEVRPLVEWEGERPAALWIRDARVFTATSEVALEHHDVLVRDGVIERVLPASTTPPMGFERARIIDGAGMTLLPGLVDAHMHTYVTGAPPWHVVWPEPEHALQEALYAGTTTVHDLCGPPKDVLALRGRVARFEIAAPRMVVAGPLLTSVNGHPLSFARLTLPGPISSVMNDYVREIPHEAHAGRTVQDLVGLGVDVIMVAVADTFNGTPTLTNAQLRAITSTAHARGLRVVAHVDTAANAARAAGSGVDALVHGVHSTALDDVAAERVARHVSMVAPTLLTFERLDQMGQGTLVLSPLEQQSVATDLQRELPRAAASGYRPPAALLPWLGDLRTHRDDRLVGNVMKLRARGVRILVATDGHGSPGSFPAGIHEEMRLLVKAGIPPVEVLLGATAWSAHLTTDTPSFGTIEPGKDADLLLVAGNPLEDISATQRIVLVISRGRLVKRLP